MTSTNSGNLFAICRERGWDWRQVLDLRSSSNPLGPAPGVGPAIQAASELIGHYPERSPERLEEACGKAWGVPPELVLAGSGASELLHYVARTGWQGPAAIVIPGWTQFAEVFPHALRVPLAQPEKWPQRGLLAFSQPVDPTGEEFPEFSLRHAIASREGPVLIDESYIEFTNLPSAIHLCGQHPNLLVLRSLSPFYALPGLRVGALVGSPDWINRLRRRRGPWPVSLLAEAAAAAALADKAHAERTRVLITEERNWLLEMISGLDALRPAASIANFIFAATTCPAQEICDWFLERQILLRNCTGRPGIEGEAIRFAVRTRAENKRFVAAAAEFFTGSNPNLEPSVDPDGTPSR